MFKLFTGGCAEKHLAGEPAPARELFCAECLVRIGVDSDGITYNPDGRVCGRTAQANSLEVMGQDADSLVAEAGNPASEWPAGHDDCCGPTYLHDASLPAASSEIQPPVVEPLREVPSAASLGKKLLTLFRDR